MGGRNRVGAAAIRGVQKQPGPRLQEPVYSQEGQSVGGREGFSAMTRIPDDSICARSVGEREAWTGCPSGIYTSACKERLPRKPALQPEAGC